MLEPVSVADRALDGTSQALLRAIERGVQLIPVGIAENQNVYISHRPDSRLARMPSRPRPVDNGATDPMHVCEHLGKYGRHSEGLDQHVC